MPGVPGVAVCSLSHLDSLPSSSRLEWSWSDDGGK